MPWQLWRKERLYRLIRGVVVNVVSDNVRCESNPEMSAACDGYQCHCLKVAERVAMKIVYGPRP